MHLQIDFRSKSNANLGQSYSEKVLKDAPYQDVEGLQHYLLMGSRYNSESQNERAEAIQYKTKIKFNLL